MPNIRLVDEEEEDDRALALQAASGCRRSFSKLISRHYDHIHRLAWRFCGRRELAEDVAHDVCVKIARAIKSYRGDAAFTTWLYRIVFTTATDCLRATQRVDVIEPSQVVSLMERSNDMPPLTPEAAALNSELWVAVRRLSPQQRDAVLLVYGEDLTHAEAAEVLGCTEKTVSWHLFEAKKRLRGVLEASG